MIRMENDITWKKTEATSVRSGSPGYGILFSTVFIPLPFQDFAVPLLGNYDNLGYWDSGLTFFFEAFYSGII